MTSAGSGPVQTRNHPSNPMHHRWRAANHEVIENNWRTRALVQNMAPIAKAAGGSASFLQSTFQL